MPAFRGTPSRSHWLSVFPTQTPGDDPRSQALHTAAPSWLNVAFLDQAPTATLGERLVTFVHAIESVVWHQERYRTQAGLIRHSLVHLLRGPGPLALRLTRCLSPDGAYSVPGIGPSFWFAIAKAMKPREHPHVSKSVLAGVSRLGFLDSSERISIWDWWPTLEQIYRQLLDRHEDRTACDLDRFFVEWSTRTSRDRSIPEPIFTLHDQIETRIRELRSTSPLRPRLAQYHQTSETLQKLREMRTPESVPAILTALWTLTGSAHARPKTRYDDQPTDLLARLPAPHDSHFDPEDPLWVAQGLLWGSDRNRPPLSDLAWQGLQVLDDTEGSNLTRADLFASLADVVAMLRAKFRIHPAEVGPLLESFATKSPLLPQTLSGFLGFSPATFQFLDQLREHNETSWMDAHRPQYRAAVREPLLELCQELTNRYLDPVLRGEYGWTLETTPRPGRALTSITRTDFGRGGPYAPVVGLQYAPRRVGPRRDDVQFLVRVSPEGVAVGWRLGRRAREAGKLFRKTVQELGPLLFQSLQATRATTDCRFGSALAPGDGNSIRTAADLRAWSTAKDLTAFRWFPASDPRLRSDSFVGDVLILWDRLVPLFAAAIEANPQPILARRAGCLGSGSGFDTESFQTSTGLSPVWLTRTLDLLRNRKQLILQGVPGTGKTHVARCLARHLTGDQTEAQRLIQFHAGYSYEEFVEGIRPQSVEREGRSDVSYPVTPGVLIQFAARAAAHPAEPHVLVIDEINRGNLARVFGELLFLLEYRDQEVLLPYSKQPFRLPPNLFVIGTMNPADRSAVGLDQAMRRRFSFVEMPPDPVVLARWFDVHPPAEADPTWGPRLVQWFEELNQKLTHELGPDRQIGHSFVMIENLTRDGLQAMWEHHLKPQLQELFPGRADRVTRFDPVRALDRRSARVRPEPAMDTDRHESRFV